ncbi:cullin-1-like [Trifolium pratense]|uniref:cullin-1-like n=1 Tax=Trifolium pratense TaxID=57577 RepID=UPI001E696BD4|nr:cullin-1-like [Trifolium pratense]
MIIVNIWRAVHPPQMNVYNMYVQEDPHEYGILLYENYKNTFEDYIGLTVLPSLREKKDELLLKELLEQWSNYKIMNKYMFKFFSYLERHYICGRNGRPTLELKTFLSFYSLVYDEMHGDSN